MMACCVFISSYAVQVTFRVDMTNQTVSGSGVFVAGSFGGDGHPDWVPNGIQMFDGDSDNIFEITINLTPGTFQYKFVNGGNWGQDENSIPGGCNVGGNRQVVIGSSDTVLPVYCFNECSFCASNPQFRSVTFKVDMQNETVSLNGVHLAGSFQYTPAPHTGPEWSPSGIEMTDGDSDGVYEVTLTLAEGYGYEYKFINDNSWDNGGAEGNISSPCGNGSNRTLSVPTAAASVLAEVCFNSCSDCVPSPDPIDVTFRVDMQNTSVSPDGVHLAGNFGADGYAEWSPNTIAMTDGDADGVYEVTLTLTEGEEYQYKFINGNDWPFAENVPSSCGFPDGGGTYNRGIAVGSSNTVLDEVCLNSCDDCTPVYDITFRVNMNYVTVSPNGVHLAGSFSAGGYPEWNPGGIAMTDDNSDGIYEVTLSLPSEISYQYKFVNGNDWGEMPEYVPSGCGVSDGGGGFNRGLDPAGDDVLDIVCFGQCVDCIPGCNDSNACNYDASANANDGSCVYATLEYYVDADGDGYGTGSSSLYCSDPGAGFSTVDGDCNDGNPAVRPGATELCSNGIDDDCDGAVNEGCPVVAVPNDHRGSAMLSAGQSFPSCGSNNGNLTSATASGECFTSAPVGAGQDVWYRFVAQTNGVRIQASSAVNDIVLELQNAAGDQLVASANETSSGMEELVVNNLSQGQTYYLAIRNFNTGAVGTFTYCIQHLTASSPNNGTTFNSLCGYIKSRWTGASLYTVTFDDGVNEAFSGSNTSTQILFNTMPELAYSTTYDVVFTTTYQVGGSTVVVSSPPYSVTIAAHAPVQLRAADRCPVTKPVGAFIGTDVLVCGATEWEWEVEQVDESGNPIGIEGPVIIETNSISRYLRTSLIPGIAPGNRYRVRVRPVFANGPGQFAAGYQYLCIAGSAGMTEPENDQNAGVAERKMNADTEQNFSLYPNPNRGEFVSVRMSAVSGDQVFVRILDVTGRETYTGAFAVKDELNVTIQLDERLKTGVYMVELTDGAERTVRRMIVE